MNREKLQSAVTAWAVVHRRADDSVMFGPFAAIADALDWLSTDGHYRGVRGTVVPLVDPNAGNDVFWTGAPDLIAAHLSSSLQ